MKRRNSSATTRDVTPRDDKKMTNVAEGWGGGATDNVGRPNKSLLLDARDSSIRIAVDTIYVSYTQTEIFALKKYPGIVNQSKCSIYIYKSTNLAGTQKSKNVDL
jgi:hypothetical protein